jgi:hypothetical protein
MAVVFTPCAGLDGHQQPVMACRLTPDPLGEQADGLMAVKELGTLTRDVLALADWLSKAGVPHVAMESTGEYWNRSTTCWQVTGRCAWSTRPM